MKSEKHKVHKYKRIIFKSGHTIYRCMLPGCPHFIRKELLPNRFGICWNCERKFQLTKESLELAKPHCNCTKLARDMERLEGRFKKEMENRASSRIAPLLDEKPEVESPREVAVANSQPEQKLSIKEKLALARKRAGVGEK